MPAKPGIPKLPTLRDLAKDAKPTAAGRPLKVPKHTIRPLGPRTFRLASDPERLGDGPGEPPAGFLNQWNSRDEWDFYWAVCKVKHSPKDCRQPPYVGGGHGDWTYQNPDPVNGGRVAGGTVYDFLVWQGGKKIALRIQTERFHIFASAVEQAQDLFLKHHASGVDDIFDLYRQNSLGQGPQALVMQVVRALKGVREIDPIRGGIARRVRA